MSWGLLWVVNRMPNNSGKPRQPVRLVQLNPYLRQERPRVSRTAKHASFDALWNAAEDTH